LAREAPLFILRLAGQCRCARLTSNVKAQETKMSSIPESIDGVRKQRDSDGVDRGVMFVVAFAVLVYGLFYAWNFGGPSGQAMSIGTFIALCFREMFIVGFYGLALVVGCVVWLVGGVRKLFRRGGDAL